MRTTRVLASIAAAALAAGGLSAVLSPAAAAAPSTADAGRAEKALRAASDHAPTITKDSSGRVRSVVAQAGAPLRRPTGILASSSPEASARGFLRSYAAAFGIADVNRDLQLLRIEKGVDGAEIVRLQQKVGGVPVLGGDIVVSAQADGDVLSATSELTAPSTAGKASVAKDKAIATAIASVAKHEKIASAKLQGTAAQWIYDPSLLIARAPRGQSLVWRVTVTTKDHSSEYNVLVDARYGDVLLAQNAHEHALDRVVCDFGNSYISDSDTCTTDSWNRARVEGGPASSVDDVNRAYRYSGATYNFYKALGRDSLDDKGMTLRSLVRVCAEGECPYYNAYWDGEKMVYGDRMAAADDVVAHELTHGVTSHTSNLFYGFQSGAINESLSDTMGEFVDQTNVESTKDKPDWQLGEDLFFGAIRNMADPTKKLWAEDTPDPDSMTSKYYVGEQPDEYGWPEDGGGVHTNSGVGNKAAYLIAAPGKRVFNGVTVTGIGVKKASQVYYRTMQLLTSGSDYADLAAALTSGCNQLRTSGTAGITATDCDQVLRATLATRMTLAPVAASARQSPDAPVCPTATTATTIAEDGMEAGTASPWTFTADNWEIPPVGVDYANAKTGKGSLSGMTTYQSTDGSTHFPASVASATWTAPVAVPTGKTTYLRFDHDRWFEKRAGVNYDGGKVEYRADGGSWTDAGNLFVDNGYTGTLNSGGRAFTALSHGYISSRLDLTPLAGKSVELRFTVVGNSGNGSAWWIDNVRAYTCTGVAGPVRNVRITPGTDGAATLSWELPAVSGPEPITSFKLASTPAVTGLPESVPVTQLSVPVTGVTKPNPYTFTVTPVFGTTAGPATTVSLKPATGTLKATPNPAISKSKVWLSGAFTYVGGGGVPSATVKVLGRQAGKTEWTQVGTAGTNSAGNWGLNVTPVQTWQYIARVDAGANTWGGESPIVSVAVAPTLTINAPASVKKGAKVSFTGATTPVRPYVVVTLQVLSGKTWKTVATAKTLSKGTYGFSLVAKTKGTFTYRVVIAGDAAYAPGTSRAVAVKVT